MSKEGSTAPTDSWGSPAATALQRHVKSAAHTVRDDWDDDDDESEDPGDPQKLWEEANQRAPMPQLVMASSSTGGVAVTSPPPAAFQPALRILKRPTTSPSSSASSLTTHGSGSSSASSSTYAEREARYQAARDRIFGDSSPSPGIPNEPSRPKTQDSWSNPSPLPVQIVRDPKGPPVAEPGATSSDGRGQGGDSRGFGTRRGKRRGGGKS